MWKKEKGILSCILAFVLLLSIANGQWFFVRADSGESPEKQVKETESDVSETDNSSLKEDSFTKGAEEKTESDKEDKKSDGQEKLEKEKESVSPEEKNTEKKILEEDKTESKENPKEKTEEENTSTEAPKVAEEIKTTEQMETETTENMEETTEWIEQTEYGTSKENVKSVMSENEKEYIPQRQPDGAIIKAYAKEGVFPEKTIMKVKKLGEKEQKQAEDILKKDKVEYDGILGYDISFFDAENKEVEPQNGSVRVVMQLAGSMFPEKISADTLEIQHLEEINDGYEVKKVASVSSGSMQVGSNKIKAEYTVNSFSDFIVTYSYVDTRNWSTKVNFYINKDSYIANSTSGGGSTMQEQFTDSVGSATVIMPDNADNYNYTIEHASDGKSTAYIVLQGDTTGSAYDIDEKIRNLDVKKAPDNSFKIDKIPTDESVLSNIRTGKVSININGQVIQKSALTTDNFKVRWYVFKYNTTDCWHVDGILVPKSGQLQVTKTFSGLTESEMNQLKSKFAIDVRGNVKYGENTGIENQYTLSLDKAVSSDNGMTYTWTVDVYNANYTVKESGMNLDYWTRTTTYSANPDASVTTGRVIDGNYDDSSGFEIQCVTRATDTGVSANQSVSLKNQYKRKTVPLKLTKTVTVNDENTDVLDMSNMVFEVRDSANELVKTISFEEFTKKSTGVYEYFNVKDDFLKAGETYTITEKNTEIDGYKFNNKKQCSQILTVQTADAAVSFANAYMQPRLTVKKLVTGNMVEKNKEFTFFMQFIKNGEKWTKNLNKKDGEDLIAQEGKYHFTLKDGESIAFNVPYGYTYHITEADKNDYKTYIGDVSTTKENYKNLKEAADKTVTGMSGDNDKQVVFVNEKNIVPPTGISTTLTAWFLMTGATILFGAVFFIFGVYGKRFRI